MDKLQLAKIGLTRGSICHWKHPFGPHLAVILNLDWPPPDGVVLFAVMTDGSRFSAIHAAEIIRTGPQDYPFLKKETVINLRQVLQADLAKITAQPEFSARSTLTAEHLKRTDEILRASLTVEQSILERVVK